MTRTYTDERRWANTDASLHYHLHVSDECTFMDHAACNDERCACPHHVMTKFDLEHPVLNSLAHAEIDRELN